MLSKLSSSSELEPCLTISSLIQRCFDCMLDDFSLDTDDNCRANSLLDCSSSKSYLLISGNLSINFLPCVAAVISVHVSEKIYELVCNAYLIPFNSISNTKSGGVLVPFFLSSVIVYGNLSSNFSTVSLFLIFKLHESLNASILRR